MNKATVLWESKGKTPAGDPFMTIKEARGYYNYAERGGKDSIAFILYDRNTDEFGLIYESKPPLDETLGVKAMLTTAFGGSIDMNKSKEEIVQIEVAEEAGYEVSLENIHYVGETLVSSQMNQICFLYFVEVTDIEKTLKAEYEKNDEKQNIKDPYEFSKNKVEWINENELMDKINDWKSIFIFLKAIRKGLIE